MKISSHYSLDQDADRKIKYTLQKQGQLHDAVMDLVTQGKKEWAYDEWVELLAAVEASELTINEYREVM